MVLSSNLTNLLQEHVLVSPRSNKLNIIQRRKYLTPVQQTGLQHLLYSDIIGKDKCHRAVLQISLVKVEGQ